MAELYQVIGAILSDITHARFTSDLCSRSISRYYEQDSLLRRFPVPRAEITELEIDLSFALSRVVVDSGRHDARDARISTILENYSSAILRGALNKLKERADKLSEHPSLTPDQRDAVVAFDAKFLSSEYRDLLRSRLLRYFEDNQAKLIDANGRFDVDTALGALKQYTIGLAEETPEIKRLLEILKVEVQRAWDDILGDVKTRLQSMHSEIQEAFISTQEYKVDIEVDASRLAQLPQPTLSSVKIKSVVRNYTWSKVDTDPKDLRAIRRLVPEA